MGIDLEDVHQRAQWLHSEKSSASGDIFGEPQKLARIGDQYQAKIPSLIPENERLQLINLPTSQDAIVYVQNQVKFGLSIPVSWVHDQQNNGILESETDNSLLPVPGSSGESWSMIEHDSFLLGLYIFGKNLRLVNKFVGNKGMPNVVSYYYGKFYRTTEHQKWSNYRKKKSKKAMLGKKIFNGWRRQELFSRLLPNLSDECKTRLTQVTRTFEEGKLPFEKYVLTLTDMVGINLLVEAVAIGKEKRDLTSRAKKPRKSKKLNSTCSSLETEEIINLLKNGIGLSNSRLHDLFWEAVWPRLLAKGWHSEQPRNYTCQNSNRSLVFLAPGVTKFSRRSLEKGRQYFDSFTEVLNKVAFEPHLLDHEPDHDRLVRLVEPSKHGSEDVQDLMKCTIVDTSLTGVVKVKELETLTGDVKVKELESFPVLETEKNTIEDKKAGLETNEKPVRKLKLLLKPKSKRHRITNTNSSDENEPMEDPLVSAKPSVLPNAGPANAQRQSTRNRPLSTKALEALSTEFLNPKKKRKGAEEKTTRRVRSKTALVSSCGARCIDGVFNGSAHMVSEAPK